MLGMTRGEIGLVVFIFALVYTAGLLPRIARGVTAAFGRRGDDA
jgi:hypothetical protein